MGQIIHRITSHSREAAVIQSVRMPLAGGAQPVVCRLGACRLSNVSGRWVSPKLDCELPLDSYSGPDIPLAAATATAERQRWTSGIGFAALFRAIRAGLPRERYRMGGPAETYSRRSQRPGSDVGKSPPQTARCDRCAGYRPSDAAIEPPFRSRRRRNRRCRAPAADPIPAPLYNSPPPLPRAWSDHNSQTINAPVAHSEPIPAPTIKVRQ
jgi:hypothetical protein